MRKEGNSFIYIMFNKQNGTLYTGVTTDLVKRVWQHKDGTFKGFTSKYGLNKLGYYEVFNDVSEAIAREKQIKGGSRLDKLKLIEGMNPNWLDLSEELW